MPKVSAGLTLRPTRIGFLVRPTDGLRVSRIMRLNACLWGGAYNPIIPTADVLPDCWRVPHEVDGRHLARQYADFFEPDVLVEAEPGLAEWMGYSALRQPFDAQLLTLDEFVQRDSYGARFASGLMAVDAFRARYERESKFVLRDPPHWTLSDPAHLSPFVEAAWGAFPEDEDLEYVARSYRDAFRPTIVDPSVETWLEHYRDGHGATPLYAGREGLETTGFGRDGLRIFIFDPESTPDLIDYWNLRIFRRAVLPVPIAWFPDLAPFLRDTIDDEYAPLIGNPNGVMHHALVQFGRSLAKESVQAALDDHLIERKPGSLHHMTGYDHLSGETSRWTSLPRRLQVSAGRRELDLALDNKLEGRFQTLSPSFAAAGSLGRARWANVMTFGTWSSDDEPATVFPLNLDDRAFPRISQGTTRNDIVSREGIVLVQQYKDWRAFVRFPTQEAAFFEWLKRQGMSPTLSGAGRIAKEMIKALGGLWGIHLLADRDLIQLLNRMAGSEVITAADGMTVSKRFDGKTASAANWSSLVQQINAKRLAQRTVEDYISKNIIRLGVRARCAYCTFDNWYPLEAVNDEVDCERCLQQFRFPTEMAHSKVSPWRYRVIGSFAVPNYAEGAYSVALTLRCLKFEISGSAEMTVCTGVEMTAEGTTREADFLAWYRSNHSSGTADAPRLVIGEAKSFAKDAFKSADIETLQTLGEKFPGAVLIAAKMADEFSPAEVERLRELARKGWGQTQDHPMRNPLVLLTGHELFAPMNIRSAWKALGGRHATWAEQMDLDDLEVLARVTQDLYLDLRQEV